MKDIIIIYIYRFLKLINNLMENEMETYFFIFKKDFWE